MNSKQRIDDYLASQSRLGLLRFITCGSVDDGKSTLIGRMLYEAQLIFEDQVAALRQESRVGPAQLASKVDILDESHAKSHHANSPAESQGEIQDKCNSTINAKSQAHSHAEGQGESHEAPSSTDEDLDFSLLVDGLAAEREQGITIDVAYRFFATEHRKFIVADTPGHEQYTRNMATGASTADVAVILVDAVNGVLTQTRRHSFICSLLGIRQVALAVNKMDLVDYRQDVYEQILADYQAFAKNLDFDQVTAIPLSALKGDNVVERSDAMPWHTGPTLIGYLETVKVQWQEPASQDFRMPVQWVSRPDRSFRGFAGTVVAGSVKPGDEVRVLPSAETAKVKNLVLYQSELPEAVTDQAVTLTLDRELDCSRGDLIVAANQPCEVADQFEVQLVWMDQAPGHHGRGYWLKTATSTVNASISDIKFKYNINTLEQLSARDLDLNDICVATLALDKPIAFEPYSQNRTLGSFVLIDRYTNATVAAGMIKFALRRATNIHAQKLEVNRQAREALNDHQARVLWFTGLSGSGKSSIADALEQRLHQQGIRTYILDGDNIRHGLNQDLGFTEADRVENIRRVAEVARLMLDAGLVVMASFISPFKAERDMARRLFDEGQFIEIFVDTPLEEAERRDVKGLYAKARRGELPNFTGIDSPYEPPENPEIRLNAGENSVETCVQQIVDYLARS